MTKAKSTWHLATVLMVLLLRRLPHDRIFATPHIRAHLVACSRRVLLQTWNRCPTQTPLFASVVSHTSADPLLCTPAAQRFSPSISIRCNAVGEIFGRSIAQLLLLRYLSCATRCGACRRIVRRGLWSCLNKRKMSEV